jgi:exosortase
VLFLALVLVTIIGYGHWVVTLLRLAFSSERYTHVLLVLPVSIALALLEARAKAVKPNFAPLPGLALILVAFVLWLAGHTQAAATPEAGLTFGIISLVVCWLGLVVLFYGVDAFRQLLFPLLFLFLLIPIPQVVVDKCVFFLQAASTEATDGLFRLVGVPVLKNGFILSLPGLDIEIAKQCSGIRSALMLLLSGLLLSHLYLRSLWTKALLVLSVVPFAIAKNAFRIFTLSMLGMHVSPDFLYGNLHRNGGIVFFILALAGMAILLLFLRKAEGQARKARVPKTSWRGAASKNWIS